MRTVKAPNVSLFNKPGYQIKIIFEKAADSIGILPQSSPAALRLIRPPGLARRSTALADPRVWDNPHPLSLMKTELVWDGKYDEYGQRRNVDVAGAAMPMQKIETVTHREVKPSHPAGTSLEKYHYSCG